MVNNQQLAISSYIYANFLCLTQLLFTIPIISFAVVTASAIVIIILFLKIVSLLEYNSNEMIFLIINILL